ncbi:hypothetical protein L1987_21233 [Smallanthus sonchifolius]|uniref:Uncharacterized protein n=1 Tax=Smallanthus sonchifolius TaxID=185202 RepID=A0ACB9ITB8_9ASTR|nr:hypothetical protein L1987_21233 [Smallanthus sonchifolius]
MVRSNIRSMGRARQSGSQLIIMLERGNEKQREHISDIIRSEHSMNDNAKKRDPDTCVVKPCNFEETESYYVEATGASVIADSSVSLINRYCAELPADKSSSISKQLVCLEACKKLHQMEALTDHLLPNSEGPSENKSSKNTEESPSGAGTTKRKELHGTIPIRAVSGTWGDKLDDGADFYAYKISLKCSIVEVKFSSFVLLLESKLDDDVSNIEMELYLVSKSVNCKVSSCVKLHLNAEQVAKGKCFQELFFNGIFSKLYVGSKQSEEPRNAEKQTVDSIMTDSESTSMIHFANRSVHKDEVTDVVVLAIHTGKIYSILEVLEDETAHSPFGGDTEKFSTFKNYFKQKYRINLVYPGQNMLLLKQSHRAHNLLVDFNGEGILHGKKIKADSCKVNTDRQRCYAHLPHELLAIIDARIDVVKSLYLLPSLMHRLESLMLASQLRAEITSHMTDVQISSSLILEAITTLRINESFSMERLELLGDSVLKYAVSCDLYLRYPKKHEGLLSSGRTLQVRNSTLYNLGIGCQLQGYIRDVAFDPTRWTTPGQLPLRPCPCDHGVETLEVPIDAKHHTEDPKVVTGKCCDLGHRWLGSKTISDCVTEDPIIDILCGCEAIKIASLHTYTPKLNALQSLESNLGYKFAVKGLLLEAITHASYQDPGIGCCYQRLEFLGDSVLDLLITRHLFNKHNDIDPGELTDLRSSSVNNENFAYAAVRRNLHPKMQWPMPILTSSEQKSKTMIEIGEGVDKRTAFNSFESRMSLTIPNCGVIELTGEPHADKKSSFDSAALLMLYELQRFGKLIIE